MAGKKSCIYISVQKTDVITTADDEIAVYTMNQTKTPTQSFYNNFRKCGPILIIISLLHSQMKCSKR